MQQMTQMKESAITYQVFAFCHDVQFTELLYIILLQMFRQQFQANCNCSLFPPSAAINNNPPFRSPQRFNPHRQNKSKKSLKCHSSSRTKKPQKSSFAFNTVKTPATDKEMQASFIPNHTASTSTRSEIIQLNEYSRNNTQNLFSNHFLAPRENEMIKQRNYQFMKNSNESIGQHYMSTRAASPLNPHDMNTQKKVTFNYQNQYDFRPASTKIFAVSPPQPIKTDYRSSQTTMTTTTLMGSCIPNNSDIRKKYLQQKCNWSKQSITQVGSSQPNKTSSIESYLILHSPQNSKFDYFSRHRTSTNVFGLSRLTEMMNEKEETESIYQGEKTHDEGGIEYSRVLISCKKLMQDKNGVLEQSDQTKLFDYDEPTKGATFKKSNLFEQIRINNR